MSVVGCTLNHWALDILKNCRFLLLMLTDCVRTGGRTRAPVSSEEKYFEILSTSLTTYLHKCSGCSVIIFL